MFYRRKLILALIQVHGGEIKSIPLQKLLFLVCQKQTEPVYDFIPHLYGSYSHSVNADLFTMVKKGILTETDNTYKRTDKKNYLTLLDEKDRLLVNQVHGMHADKNANGLMKYTYQQFPFYAINSRTATNLLTEIEISKVKAAKPALSETILFTIGYEGISLEAYLNKLIKNDIKVLVDVRHNPLSQKFGFSKSQLEKYCKLSNIEYLHIPEVGIQSEYRKELKNQADYDTLFHFYNEKTISATIPTQENLLVLLKNKERIALTCFEADICQCHRKHLAEAIAKLPDWHYKLKHI
jgi:uncharacterized protein (DUF488 family)